MTLPFFTTRHINDFLVKQYDFDTVGKGSSIKCKLTAILHKKFNLHKEYTFNRDKVGFWQLFLFFLQGLAAFCTGAGGFILALGGLHLGQ